MFELSTKNGPVLVFAETIEQEAISQIYNMANSPVGENAHIRIMPDAHAGKGCTIGTTMRITDKVCPNLVGVDIGCGVLMVKTNIDFASRLNELDRVIREQVPSGFSVHSEPSYFAKNIVDKLICADSMDSSALDRAYKSLGTLGGGNHFIEAYEDGWIAVHTGSRNLGVQVCKEYQAYARDCCSGNKIAKDMLSVIPAKLREDFIKSHTREKVQKDLEYLADTPMQHYLHDMRVCQSYAHWNRNAILGTIISAMNGLDLVAIESVHNYIDVSEKMLRKGAISAQKGERCIIPLNMRDGVLICRGKGNPDWNFSAPHGAGRLYSRSAAKAKFTVDQYREAMDGIYTTCVSQATLDEAPFAYKDMEEIMRCVEPTVTIEQRLKPIYNFKAN